MCITLCHCLSVQAPSRDLMLNEFVSKKNSMGTILRNPAKMEETKRFGVTHTYSVFGFIEELMTNLLIIAFAIHQKPHH